MKKSIYFISILALNLFALEMISPEEMQKIVEDSRKASQDVNKTKKITVVPVKKQSIYGNLTKEEFEQGMKDNGLNKLDPLDFVKYRRMTDLEYDKKYQKVFDEQMKECPAAVIKRGTSLYTENDSYDEKQILLLDCKCRIEGALASYDGTVGSIRQFNTKRDMCMIVAGVEYKKIKYGTR